MKTPKEYTKLLKDAKLTEEIIAQCTYSVNKRAKNHRDKIKELKESRYNQYKYQNIEKAEEKMEEYYEQKSELLSVFSPKVIHKQFIGPETKRVYSYQKDYRKLLEEKNNSIIYTNSYYDWENYKEVDFFDYETGRERYLYFLYYEFGGYSFHSPIDELSTKGYPELMVEEIDSTFKTYGADITDLLSIPFVKKVIELIKSQEYTLIN
ncbi:TPA: hypothetical protein U2E34_001347 [Streptococcus suis]|uniref:hypothetical protein n=2 Tax=Streptococcus suis TaxID=1307 RepID=UPI000CF595D0|nr:hypothetical protein [Streptococcus suis]MCK4020342.1 hypothetical protein [Streptococcus suis]HEL9643328.1 hypothetical protein [Streptococcus suis]HEM5105828.1 hypothetical protein [Streptococcus suis]HEM5111608.1 hypothetical protein [Streptococcus suis]HEM5201400.1 hypothetical protein [Streptococcus suis]